MAESIDALPTRLDACQRPFYWLKYRTTRALQPRPAVTERTWFWHTPRPRPSSNPLLNITARRLCLVIVPALTQLALAGECAAASFDCAKATARLDRLICANERLSQLDESLNQEYRKALAMGPDAEQIKSAQRSWLKSRNACQNAGCLEQTYRLRIAKLQATHQDTPAPAPAQPDSGRPYAAQRDAEVGENARGEPTYVVSLTIRGYDKTRLNTDQGACLWAPWLPGPRLAALQSMAEGLHGQRARITYSKSAPKDGETQCWVEAIARNIGFLEKHGKDDQPRP